MVIMPGVRIGEGCIIGANSLVTKDCEPDAVYVGSPAARRRELNDRPGARAIAGATPDFESNTLTNDR